MLAVASAVVTAALRVAVAPLACVTVKSTFSGPDPPGQYSWYLPGLTLSENVPDRPGVMFSFSPRMVSPLISSASVTAPASLFTILKVTGPDSMFAVSGEQPFEVRVTVTVFFAAVEPEPPESPESLPPHATAPVAITMAMALYATGARRT
ncbi:exported hypothetical protein [Frankia canadensis]|uniref:Secreted protein n=1 Tax=Frankia canadensis TaxID=1836972 RepID=A0A2I2KLC4_9ACTN|nr:exported hypothetical protein [Frankia canadensis]SOU53736.1 exported hypothetical protein [Frankia canadensis]